MKNKSIIIIISVILVLTIAGVIFCIIEKRNNNEIEKAPQKEVVIQEGEKGKNEPKIELVDTNNWMTYRDEKYRFEIKYDPDWKITNDGYVAAIGGETLSIIINEDIDDMHIGINRFELDKNPREWIREEGIIGITSEKQLYINGYPVYYMEEDNSSVHLIKNYLVSNNNGEMVWFSFQEKYRKFNPNIGRYEETSFSQYLPEFEAMVNSIRFFD